MTKSGPQEGKVASKLIDARIKEPGRLEREDVLSQAAHFE